jgi:pimeloyl-ACP methyl ester carboxylesterase
MVRRLRARHGIPATDPRDDHYYRTVSFREPGGLLLDIATEGPGLTRDEAEGALGRSLRLPPHLEERRREIAAILPPLPSEAAARAAGIRTSRAAIVQSARLPRSLSCAPPTMGKQDMTTITTKDGTEIYYKDWGTGRPILFSHGWPLSADMWDAQMLFFAEAGYRAVAFDRRGFGRSGQPWGGYDYDTMADDIAALVDALGLRDIVLVGFSMGGGDVTRYIARHGSGRVAKLALISAVTPIFGKTADHDGPDKAFFDGLRAGIVKDRAQFLDDFNPIFYGTNKGTTVSQGVFKQTLQIALMASIKATVACATAFAETDFRPDMLKIDVPTLVVHGDADQVVPFESTGKLAAEMIRGATLKVYPGAPHATATTHAGRLNADLLAFIEG